MSEPDDDKPMTLRDAIHLMAKNPLDLTPEARALREAFYAALWDYSKRFKPMPGMPDLDVPLKDDRER